MLLNKSTEKCCGCGACMEEDRNNKRIIGMDRDVMHFYYAMHSISYSVDDGWKAVCPYYAFKEIDIIERENYHLDNYRGYEIFNKIAGSVISNGGIVYGLTIDAETQIISCKGISKIEQIEEINVPHKIKSSTFMYSEVEALLKSGKYVLFSGVPCEIEGLRLFLKKDYANLLCIGFRCDGVASPRLWRDYLDYREIKAGGTAVKIELIPSKERGKIKITFDNGKVYKKELTKDLYFKMIASGTGIRESCNNCSLRKDNRVCDIEIDENSNWLAVNTNNGKRLVVDVFGSLKSVEAVFDDSKVNCRFVREEEKEKIISRLESWPHKWFLKYYSKRKIKN